MVRVRSMICWPALCYLFVMQIATARLDDEDKETENARREKELYKGYTGFHLFSNTVRKVFHHDLTIAVVEFASNNTLMNCELIEVFNDEQQNAALHDLTTEISEPTRMNFDEMMKLMSQCNELDRNVINGKIAAILRNPSVPLPESESAQSSIFSGFVSGTKWCGPGDRAKTYYDLGPEEAMDKCCRAHDLCPVKIRKFTTRYNLTNDMFFTKSHCACDDQLSACLRAINEPAANAMAIFYFNVLKIPCLVDEKDGTKGTRPAKHF